MGPKMDRQSSGKSCATESGGAHTQPLTPRKHGSSNGAKLGRQESETRVGGAKIESPHAGGIEKEHRDFKVRIASKNALASALALVAKDGRQPPTPRGERGEKGSREEGDAESKPDAPSAAAEGDSGGVKGDVQTRSEVPSREVASRDARKDAGRALEEGAGEGRPAGRNVGDGSPREATAAGQEGGTAAAEGVQSLHWAESRGQPAAEEGKRPIAAVVGDTLEGAEREAGNRSMPESGAARGEGGPEQGAGGHAGAAGAKLELAEGLGTQGSEGGMGTSQGGAAGGYTPGEGNKERGARSGQAEKAATVPRGSEGPAEGGGVHALDEARIERLAEEVAGEIEAALYAFFGGSGNPYRQQSRMLQFNLKDPKNPELRAKVLAREVTPKQLCTATADQVRGPHSQRLLVCVVMLQVPL
jgi:hypothetical protein